MRIRSGAYQIAFDAHLGVTEEERAAAQPILVDLEWTGRANAFSDRLEETVDYDTLCRKVLAIGRQCRVHLLETLAEKMVEAVIQEPGVLSVRVRVKKCRPPLQEIQGGFVVEIERRRRKGRNPI